MMTSALAAEGVVGHVTSLEASFNANSTVTIVF